jgi:hypothetical protein
MKRIPLTQGKFALVDDRDYWLVRQFKWCAQKAGRSWYASARAGMGHILLHRLLAGFPPFHLDHRNGDGLDNRRRNLRPATPQENAMNKKIPSHNTSGFRGVSWHKPSKKWIAHIMNTHLGLFSSPILAHRAYVVAAKKHFGEFARLK